MMTTAELVAEIDALLHRLKTARDILASINSSATVKQAAPKLQGTRKQLNQPQDPAREIPAPRQRGATRPARPFEPHAVISPVWLTLSVASAQEVAIQREEQEGPLAQITESQHSTTGGTLDALIEEAAARAALGSTA